MAARNSKQPPPPCSFPAGEGMRQSMGLLTHIDQNGQARMVDVGEKLATVRFARARAIVQVGPRLVQQLRKTGALAKGNVLETARLAGIMAAKQTSLLIPLCHSLPLDLVEVQAKLRGGNVIIETLAKTRASTGVEMEALTAATIAALTVYDMCKAAKRDIAIGPVYLLEKSGGRSGHWRKEEAHRGRRT